ncbi:N-acetylglucosamine-6-phosphate deacetylase [Paenibacillus rhizosphaerae]|uniref:N-acetylglucosamine-6-phosphate deacetylase n=1 Tax=Paenibacillus rhizosphaerae TaxID=297318 RepID=A0A839TPA0_9BACL|nr:N-acetylglucosamine-6-phosphate deacetylase [Paenibacillus rhizosphaerae]MBB3128595.1 N-acetylglucosamine-6-phosphate deacetylase [Paenibacillus rhizosphaerae]
MTSWKIYNVQVALPDRIADHATVWVEEGRITGIQEHTPSGTIRLEIGEIPTALCESVDGQGQLLIPGMIDVHIHGANGFDMMDGMESSIQEVSRICALTGCTSFLATSVTSSLEDLMSMIRSVKQVAGKEVGARIAGIHLEGPYLNVKRKGMQNEKYLRHPDIQEMAHIFKEAGDLIRMVTIAPELPGGMELLTWLIDRGVIVALAHSDATYEEAKLAFQAGASHVTHCFNGMRPIHHRDPGLVAAAFEEPHVSLQAIVDHVHLHPAIVRLMHRLKGASGMVLITDALQAMGLGDGVYQFGGHEVTVTDGTARLKDGTLASSTVTMNEALKHTVELGISLTDAVQMASMTPARVLGLDQIGNIEIGNSADLVLLNERFGVVWTMIGGRVIHDEHHI